ncbi:MAG: hypothetical protein ABIR81_06875 [Ginsengibacter sp.]
MKKIPFTQLIFTILIVTVASCSKADIEELGNNLCPGCSSIYIININSIGFSPDSVVVKSGTLVSWINFDTVAHSVKSLDNTSFDSADSTLGSFSYDAETPGTFHYNCTIHHEKGVLVVKP